MDQCYSQVAVVEEVLVANGGEAAEEIHRPVDLTTAELLNLPEKILVTDCAARMSHRVSLFTFSFSSIFY